MNSLPNDLRSNNYVPKGLDRFFSIENNVKQYILFLLLFCQMYVTSICYFISTSYCTDDFIVHK